MFFCGFYETLRHLFIEHLQAILSVPLPLRNYAKLKRQGERQFGNFLYVYMVEVLLIFKIIFAMDSGLPKSLETKKIGFHAKK